MTRFVPDTSCIVAAACAWHEHHAATAAELARRAGARAEPVLAAPALVEAYAVLTRLPPPYRLRPSDALAVIEGSWSRAKVVALSGGETWKLVRSLPAAAVSGGRVYDALIAACARKARAASILTWNLRDFAPFAEGLEIQAPRTV